MLNLNRAVLGGSVSDRAALKPGLWKLNILLLMLSNDLLFSMVNTGTLPSVVDKEVMANHY